MTMDEQWELRTKLWGIEWPGHPAGCAKSESEISLRDEPSRWKCLHVSNDPGADYSYDDLALMVRDDGLYVLVETTGCSCPSPTETWGVVKEGTLSDMVALCEKDKTEWGDGVFHGPWGDMYTFLSAMPKDEPKAKKAKAAPKKAPAKSKKKG